jgi:hypothetical protein
VQGFLNGNFDDFAGTYAEGQFGEPSGLHFNWTFSAVSSGIVTKSSPIAYNQVSPAGTQAAFINLDNAAYIQQTVNWQTGATYRVDYYATKRAWAGNCAATATVYVTQNAALYTNTDTLNNVGSDIATSWVLIDTQQACESSWASASSDNFVPTANSGTVRVMGGDITIVDGFELILVSTAPPTPDPTPSPTPDPTPVPTPDPTPQPVQGFLNGDFQDFAGDYPEGQFGYLSGLHRNWTFSGVSTGITTRTSPLAFNHGQPSPAGAQTVFIGSEAGAYIQQTINWQSGTGYRVDFQTIKRAWAGNCAATATVYVTENAALYTNTDTLNNVGSDITTSWVLIDTQQACESSWSAGSSATFTPTTNSGTVRIKGGDTTIVDGFVLVTV